ncbi:flagellar hook-associated protein 2 [Klenkia marina]|uniref:Flagellar hook-associated protein 2 n=1 Tax=Klenkia marina TaxID=1960309 RepID=A0A1G4XB12_9ACTN|nr:flagellar filament capping protein FliD [Klenkia marina]SCX38347.1 flagellar hook-associated protein 2 [Klenkia marina]
MVNLGIDGLASGLDTTSIIANLMKIEARPQDLLKTQLTDTQAKAAAYRAVNTRLDAVRSAAEALTTAGLAAARSASSSSSTVTASASAAAATGATVRFDVVSLATAHTVVLGQDFTSTTAPLPSPSVPAFPIEVRSTDGTKVGRIALPANASLLDAVSAVNASSYGLNATIIQVEPGHYRLQVSAKETGAANAFTITQDDGSGSTQVALDDVAVVVQGGDAELDLGLGDGTRARSATNTFTDLVPGTSITVSKKESGVTVSVGTDNSAVTAKVKALVDAANGALSAIKVYSTSTAGTTKATLQGDSTLVRLSGELLSTISSAVGGGSASSIGLQLSKDGTISFDPAVFSATLAKDPATVARLVSGTAASTVGGVTTPAVTGIAGAFAALARAASDPSTGSLTMLASGRDTLADTLQDRIDALDIRLDARRAALTKQFTTLETALGTIKNQSAWLSSQIGQLYSPNKSS